jgi:hypothetical protein
MSVLFFSTFRCHSLAITSVVKSRLQAGSADALKYKSSLDGLLTILKEEGIEGLYKGIGSKIVQSVLTAAILFAGQRRIFEITKQARFFFPFFLPFLTPSGRLRNRSSEPRDT